MRQFGHAVDRTAQAAKDRLRRFPGEVDMVIRGRTLTRGELAMIRWMFGAIPNIERTRVYPLNFWWPYPNDRAMTPNDNIFFPHQDFRDDFSLLSVDAGLRALFMHEATHLYQHYVLGMWLMLRGPFDRNYDYQLERDKPLRAYGIEQMGQIVEDFYLKRHGRRVLGRTSPLDAYADAVPVRS